MAQIESGGSERVVRVAGTAYSVTRDGLKVLASASGYGKIGFFASKLNHLKPLKIVPLKVSVDGIMYEKVQNNGKFPNNFFFLCIECC